MQRILFPGPSTPRSPRYLTLRPRGREGRVAAIRDAETEKTPKDGEANGEANGANAGGKATEDSGMNDAGEGDAGGQAADDAAGTRKEKATSGPEASGGRKMATGCSG